MLRKGRLPRAAAVKAIKGFLQNCEICIEDETVARQAIQLFERFSFQSYDAKIVAAALRAGCTVLYSEDFQPGLVVSDSLTILNPFLALPEA